ncbi:NAD-dependent epimerase/dehydratase family protein [Halogeometricum borinquense]|uniref:Nucleoside-diphosphate-sugar epimerase n=1 Tax=Halogeometricum borinquense (strain ATCC 700274 / DSM 11551 / JCM 10706 / KCTC 4070 / PR3) TaxID=469382 RepID=E4NLR6_HALBP|nr:NAD-dependent epimerase/dehydratase family protein [Halogeometricum borinquense]ADQ67269.1 nucleoside-diphosphate-sugar epimerase [Halogeometricum borinquense DSM 11551]
MTTLDSVLVTGGAGFVGSHAVEYYAERGSDVTALDNLSRTETLEKADESRNTAAYNWNYIEENYPDVELVEADIRDFETLESIVEGHDAIVHTAGQVAVTASLTDPRTDFEVNAEGTFNVLEAARKADSDPAVVVASTNKVYGNNVNEIPVREEENRYWYDDSDFENGIPETLSIDGCEHTPYGVSKLTADLYVQDYAERGAVDAAAFRMSCIYGTRQFGNEDQGWVAHFAISTLRDEPLTIFGDGKQVRDVLYVKDLIRAYDAFLSDPEDKPAVYNIGGGAENTTSLLEFLDILESKTGTRTDISYDEWREGDQKVYVSDTSRAREHLDWEAQVSFEEGIERFVDWYENR